MRFLREALIATVLLGCSEDSSGPEQAQVEGESSGLVESSGSASVAGLAADDEIRPTRGFYVEGFPNGGTVGVGTDFTEIQRFSSLPSGKYIANASAVLASNDPELRYVDCIFTIGGAIRGEMGRGMVGGTGRDDFVSLPLAIGFTINTASDLGVACRSDISGVVFSQSSPITAIRVDRLTAQHP